MQLKLHWENIDCLYSFIICAQIFRILLCVCIKSFWIYDTHAFKYLIAKPGGMKSEVERKLMQYQPSLPNKEVL
jgi:hypothetical protein